MNLQELKNLVAEEYSKFLEQDDEKDKDAKADAPKGDDKKGDDSGAPKKAKAPKVKAGGGDLDVGGDEDPEKTLRDIFNMLKDFFEGDKKDDAPKKPDAPKADAPKGPEGPAAGGPGGDTPPDAMKDMGMLQERFKKLANIIK